MNNIPEGLTINENVQLSIDVKNCLEVLNDIHSLMKNKSFGVKSKSSDNNIESLPKGNEKNELSSKEGKLVEKATELIQESKNIFEKNQDTMLANILGPLRIITAPLDKFTSGFFSKKLKSTLFGGDKGKSNPNKNDVLKLGVLGSGFLFVASKLDKLEDEKKEKSIFEKIKDFFGKNGTFMTSVLPTLGKTIGNVKDLAIKGSKKLGRVGGGIALAGGLISSGIDAYKGINQSWIDEEGKELSKGTKAFGGFFGGISSGMEGAFSNMGKWASMGFGIGNLIFPGIGGLVGGGIGALLGGVLGFIGGEKIAQFGEKAGTWFKDVFWVGVKNFFSKLWNSIVTSIKFIFNVDKFTNIWKSDDSIITKIFKTIVNGVITVVTLPFRKILSAGVFIKNMLKDTKFGKAVSGFFTSFFSNNAFGKKLANAINITKEGFKGISSIFDNMFNGLKWNKDIGVIDNVKNIVNTIFNNLKISINDFFENNPLGKIIKKYIVDPISNTFKELAMVFDFIKQGFTKEDGSFDFIGGAKNMLGFFDADKKKGTQSTFEKWKENKLKEYEVDDAIIRTDGSIIKTHPNDTLVALKNVDTSFKSVRQENNGSKIEGYNKNDIHLIISLLKRIAEKELNLQLPQQTRFDMDVIMSGGLL